MSKPKKSAAPVLMSITIGQNHLIRMMDRASEAARLADDKVLLSAKSEGDEALHGVVAITAAGTPLGVVSRSRSSDGAGTLVHKPGACVLHLSDLRRVVSAMPTDLLDIACDVDGKMTFEAAGHADKPRKRAFTVSAEPEPEDRSEKSYPELPGFPVDGPVRTVPGPVLSQALGRVDFATSDTTSDVYSGILVIFSEGRLRTVATNRAALAICTLDAKVGLAAEEMILPKPLYKLALSMAEDNDKLCIAQSEQRIFIEDEHTLVCCLRHIGIFPPWLTIRDAVASSATPVCKLDSLQLAEALRSVCTLFQLSYVGKAQGEPVIIELEGPVLTVSAGFTAGMTEMAKSSEELEVGNDANVSMRRWLEGRVFASSATQARGAAVLKSDARDPLGPILLVSADGAFECILSPRADPRASP